ncbi:histidine kinase, partial [Streptomyces sp. UNOC14_S4]|uniref:histidine kinase n=1 Tax=Streptomyces sp. UNOC14_S4 TaxID=2872340 RepID=UPI001E354249
MVVAVKGEPPPWFATCIILSVQSAVATLGFLNLLTARPPASHVALYIGGFVMMLSLQGVHCADRATRLRARAGGWALALQAALTYGLLPVLGLAWGGMPGFLAGSMLLTLEPPLSTAVFCGTAAFTGVYAWLVGQQPLGVGIGVLSCTVNGLMVYGMTLLASWSVELRRARDEIARLAVQEERLRVARDLHDLLGYSLSAITLKGELTDRLIREGSDGRGGQDGHAGRARAELREMVDISR